MYRCVKDEGSITETVADHAGVIHVYLRAQDGKYTKIDVDGKIVRLLDLFDGQLLTNICLEKVDGIASKR